MMRYPGFKPLLSTFNLYRYVAAGRDHMGKIPCYVAYGKDGSVWFSSEMKTLVDDPGIAKYEIFPPGHYYLKKKGEEGEFVRWYDPEVRLYKLNPVDP
jgi:asparagine synthetase B (glutamine-hydrolysing)